MINKSKKMNDAKCSNKYLFVCQMLPSKNGFLPVLTLGDHLTNIERDIERVKSNITDMNEVLNRRSVNPDSND